MYQAKKANSAQANRLKSGDGGQEMVGTYDRAVLAHWLKRGSVKSLQIT